MRKLGPSLADVSWQESSAYHVLIVGKSITNVIAGNATQQDK